MPISRVRDIIALMTSHELRTILYRIPSLESGQRDMVFAVIEPYSEDGTLKSGEWEYKVKKKLKNLMQTGKISDTDYEAIKAALKDHIH